MEHDIPFGNSNRENGTTFLDFPLFLGIFQWDEPTKRVPFTAEPEIPEILTKWKAPSIFRSGKEKIPGKNPSIEDLPGSTLRTTVVHKTLTILLPGVDLCRRNAASVIALERAEWFDLQLNFLF